jgi:NAD(P)-dependent dehydrogenase (short-subunit alcohol dehydrogenase family)
MSSEFTCPPKAGIIGFTKTLALEGARHGINCNVVCPGIIESESFHLIPLEMKERLAKRTAFRKPGEPEDVANAIVFLASDKAKYITGIVLNVSGGIELFTPLEIMPRCSAAGLDFRIIPVGDSTLRAGFNAPLGFES